MPAIRKNFTLMIVATLLFLVASVAYSDPAPDFTLPTDQGEIHLSDLKGKVVYLDFWASWCGPCRKSFPWMNDIQSRYGDKGLVILAVNLDTDAAAARQFLEKYPAHFQVAYDSGGKAPALYDVKGMPSSFFINRDGQLHSAHQGFHDKDAAALEATVQSLLAQ